MSRALPRLAAAAAFLLACVPAAPAADDKPKEESPSEKIRKALDRPIDLELKESSIIKGAERFGEKTGFDIIIDRHALVEPNGVERIVPEGEYPVEGKFKGIKLRDALRKAFEPYGLTPFIVDDAVLLTREDMGAIRQLKQRVDVDVDDVPLAAAVKGLARRKAVNIVVDQKVGKQAEKKVSLQVDDVALETAVRLLAEQAGLKAARVDNVLYITSAEQAASIAAENRANTPPPPYGVVGGNGAFGPFGAVGAIGLAGNVGVLGAGGGVAGLAGIGGGMRGAPPPPPPTKPEAPKANDLPPKDRTQAPARKPVVAAADRHGPDPAAILRPELWAVSASRTSRDGRRSRRRGCNNEPRM
jgi:hypothetical protein